MRRVFAFERVAVIVGPWWEPVEPPEYGARVEVRLIAPEPARGTPSAAQRVVVDMPVWRADLFDQVGAPVGNLLSAHFHQGFNGVEPRPRQWDDAINRDPLGWLRGQLGDLVGICARAGRPAAETDDPALAHDAEALCSVLDEVAAAVESTWAAVRAEYGDVAPTTAAT